MKNTEGAERTTRAIQMASAKASSRARGRLAPRGITAAVWMGPPAWRLPSGKALAEFALQSGFLAPALLNADAFRQPASGCERRNASNRGLADSGSKGCGR